MKGIATVLLVTARASTHPEVSFWIVTISCNRRSVDAWPGPRSRAIPMAHTAREARTEPPRVDRFSALPRTLHWVTCKTRRPSPASPSLDERARSPKLKEMPPPAREPSIEIESQPHTLRVMRPCTSLRIRRFRTRVEIGASPRRWRISLLSRRLPPGSSSSSS